MNTTRTFKIHYQRTPINQAYSQTEHWKKTELFCPYCGQREVWREFNGVDFELGDKHICTACERFFYLPDGCEPIFLHWDKQRLAALKAPEEKP